MLHCNEGILYKVYQPKNGKQSIHTRPYETNVYAESIALLAASSCVSPLKSLKLLYLFSTFNPSTIAVIPAFVWGCTLDSGVATDFFVLRNNGT